MAFEEIVLGTEAVQEIQSGRKAQAIKLIRKQPLNPILRMPAIRDGPCQDGLRQTVQMEAQGGYLMTLYIAVTPDHLELPMYVAETAEEMAEWAGVKVQSVKSSCSRNKRRGPLPPGFGISAPYRLRRLDFEEDEP